MIALALAVSLAMAPPNPEAPKPTAADALTLRNGKVLLGQVLSPAKRGDVEMIVRRSWAEKEVPDLLKKWEASAEPLAARARSQRRRRLEDWKEQRAASAGPGDRILAWIDRELGKLDPAKDSGQPPLLVVSFRRNEVRKVKRVPDGAGRSLRLGWLSGFHSPETLTLEHLKESLQFRGFDPSRRDPVNIDELLPIPVENEARWRARRAATEAAHDPDLKFLEMGPMLIPDQAARGGMNVSAMSTGLVQPGGPARIADQLRSLVPSGRVAAVVTRQQTDLERDAASASISLYIREPDGSWIRRMERTSTVRVADLPAADPQAPMIGAGPEISISVFSFSMGFNGQTITRSHRSSPRLGAASRQAAEDARAAFDQELARMALKVD